MADEIDLRDYWERRLSDDFTLQGTGYTGLGVGFNRWSYRVQRRVFLRAARPLLGDAAATRVLDIGSGTGFWIERWHELGVGSITGSDITAKSVSTLAARFPEDRFVQLDVGGEDLSALEGPYDVISAIAVLYHIVDDAAYELAFHNLASQLPAGGHLIFSDNFVREQGMRAQHQTVRPGLEIERIAAEAGFEIVERRPLFVLTNTPTNSDSALLGGWWKRLSGMLMRRGETAGSVVGAALYPAELAAVSLARRAPSLELVVCRKRGR